MFDGVEVGVRLDDSPALTEAKRFFDHAMANADMRFVPNPTQRELDQGLSARWQQRWTLGRHLTVRADDATWRRLTTAATAGPVLWEEASGLRLYLAGLMVTLVPTPPSGLPPHRRAEQTHSRRAPRELVQVHAWGERSPPRLLPCRADQGLSRIELRLNSPDAYQG